MCYLYTVSCVTYIVTYILGLVLLIYCEAQVSQSSQVNQSTQGDSSPTLTLPDSQMTGSQL